MTQKFLTAKQILEKVENHLLAQNTRAIDSSDLCRYKLGRGKEALRCAIGCLIPSESYCRDIEASGLDYTFGLNKINTDGTFLLEAILLDAGVPLWDKDILELLEALRDIHDYSPTHLWTSRFAELRMRHGLPPRSQL